MIPDADDPNQTDDYAGGEIQSRRGGVNVWLIVVYVALTIWAIYYLIRYWGGLGPGLAQ